MKIYLVYMIGSTSVEEVKCFNNKQTMIRYINEDVKKVCELLKQDGYTPCIAKRCYDTLVTAKNTDIYYEWSQFESELIED